MKTAFSDRLSGGLDGLISFFSPRAGFKRSMFRQAIKLSDSFGSYKGASRH